MIGIFIKSFGSILEGVNASEVGGKKASWCR